jgi:hypothetical protein
LKKLFARVAELGYQLNLSDKAKHLLLRKVLTNNLGKTTRAIQSKRQLKKS